VWALVLAMIFVTYWRLDPDTRAATDDLYHVSGNGLVGGLSRVLVELNFPMAIIAALLALVALDALPRRAWLVAGPAIALCAVVAWPGVVDQDDLDARLVNAVPALGLGLAFGLTVAATLRSGGDVARRLPLDPLRLGIAIAVLLVSIPWVAADLGFFLPDGVFIMRRVAPDSDGWPIAAVHLGHHHGMDGSLVALSALLLSRPRLRAGRTATVTVACAGLVFAYGIVNCVQDTWNEQLVKRGKLEWKIPSAIYPKLAWIWLVIVALGALTTWLLSREGRSVDSPA
jgi:hypothetical protein